MAGKLLFQAQDIVYDLQMAGVAGIIHFDIDRFEEEAATSPALTMEMKQRWSSRFIRTVRNLDDVAQLNFTARYSGRDC